MAGKGLTPGQKVLIKGTVLGYTGHGTVRIDAGGITWEVTNGWPIEPDPQFNPSAEERELAAANYTEVCRTLGVDYGRLEAGAIAHFDRGKTGGRGFAVYIRQIVLTRIREAQAVGMGVGR